jgi:glycosyltransferase involved in cell wall biosynthesis
LVDFGLMDRTVISLEHIPDSSLAQAYSACDLTIGPGAEGFGYPLIESQFCGTPVVTGSYAGGGDITPQEMQVDPVGFRFESIWSCERPVYNVMDWSSKAEELIGLRCNRPDEYDWNRLWPRWESWFREALNDAQTI